MKFRDDIDPDNTWVVSDTHWGHENIVAYCARPLDVEELMLANWRAEVPDDATLIHLGDLVWNANARFKHIVSKELTGARKLLILGNHDKQRFSYYRDCGFRVVKPFQIAWTPHPASSANATWNISFSHYPWNDSEDGCQDLSWQWRLHGHIHNNGYWDGRRTEKGDRLIPFLRNHINLSVEQTQYKPVNLKLLLDAAILGRLPS
jgi:calcineurin-like phosphoesterase family protein